MRLLVFLKVAVGRNLRYNFFKIIPFSMLIFFFFCEQEFEPLIEEMKAIYPIVNRLILT